MALSAKEEYIAQCMTTGKTREECEQTWNQAHADQQTKEEYIKECMGGGKTREECEAAWGEAHQGGDIKAKDWVTLARENAMQRVKIEKLSDMLKTSTSVVKSLNEELLAKTEADKYNLAVEIERDSFGRMKHSELMKESYKELCNIKRAQDLSKPTDFVSTSALLEESERRKEPQLTVGEYDPIAKKWKGGR